MCSPARNRNPGPDLHRGRVVHAVAFRPAAAKMNSWPIYNPWRRAAIKAVVAGSRLAVTIPAVSWSLYRPWTSTPRRWPPTDA
jgi:hypothetical protein